MPRDANDLERYILDNIPLARTMQLRVAAWDGTRLDLAAPLEPNINDKGCAFGGSLGSLMTLAGWGVTVLTLAAQDIAADVFVAHSEVRYRAPLTDRLAAHALPAPGQDLARFVKTLRSHGKARLVIHAAVAAGMGDACTQTAEFAARLRT